jgi:DNA-binding transcriptional LysR family regulator
MVLNMMTVPTGVPSLAGTLPNLESFCRTFETGSFTKAARALSVTPQATSRSVARLEKALGVTLFRRTTRSLAPTEAAQRYYELCVQALTLLSTGERDITAHAKAPSGRVRISVPSTYGLHRLLPALGTYRDRFPNVLVDISVSNQNIDFVRGGYDLAIRMGTIADQTMVVRKLGDFPLGVYASGSYLARQGTPQTPADLERHTCIGFVVPSTGRVLPWTFSPAPKRFEPDGTYRCSDDVLGNVALARAGVGLVQIYDFMVEEDVAQRRLTEVLTAFRGGSRPFSLLYPKNVRLSRAARSLSDFITTALRPPNPSNQR